MSHLLNFLHTAYENEINIKEQAKRMKKEKEKPRNERKSLNEIRQELRDEQQATPLNTDVRHVPRQPPPTNNDLHDLRYPEQSLQSEQNFPEQISEQSLQQQSPPPQEQQQEEQQQQQQEQEQEQQQQQQQQEQEQEQQEQEQEQQQQQQQQQQEQEQGQEQEQQQPPQEELAPVQPEKTSIQNLVDILTETNSFDRIIRQSNIKLTEDNKNRRINTIVKFRKR